MDAVACAIVHEELSASDPGFALATAHSMLFVNNLAYNGNEEQRLAFFPRFARRMDHAMAMSEPDAGTDVLGLSTAVQRDDGSWVVNGRRCGSPTDASTKTATC